MTFYLSRTDSLIYVKRIEYREYKKFVEETDDKIQSTLDYKSIPRLKRSFSRLVEDLVQERPIPHQVKGSLNRQILLELNFERAAIEVLVYNNTREDDLELQYGIAGFAYFEKGIRLSDIVKKLKRLWVI